MMKISSIHKNRDNNLKNTCGPWPSLSTVSCLLFHLTHLSFPFVLMGFLKCLVILDHQLPVRNKELSCFLWGVGVDLLRSCLDLWTPTKAYCPLNVRGDFFFFLISEEVSRGCPWPRGLGPNSVRPLLQPRDMAPALVSTSLRLSFARAPPLDRTSKF